MEREEIRLECLRVAAIKTADHQVVLATAKDYFDFVTEPDPEKKAETKNFMGIKKPFENDRKR